MEFVSHPIDARAACFAHEHLPFLFEQSEEMRLELAKNLIDAQMDINEVERGHADEKLALEKV